MDAGYTLMNVLLFFIVLPCFPDSSLWYNCIIHSE